MTKAQQNFADAIDASSLSETYKAELRVSVEGLSDASSDYARGLIETMERALGVLFQKHGENVKRLVEKQEEKHYCAANYNTSVPEERESCGDRATIYDENSDSWHCAQHAIE